MPGERPDSPDLTDVVQAFIEQALAEVHTAMPGRVERYDAGTQRATVLPLVRYPNPQPDGSVEYEDLPPLAEVPVLFPRAGGFFVALPVEVGDTVLLVSQETAVGHWEAGDGGVSFPGDLRRHHLAHCVCLPGYYVRSKPLAHAPSSGAMVLGADAANGPRLTLASDGTITIVAGGATRLQIDPDGTVHLAGHPATDLLALGGLVDAQFTALKNIFTAWIVASGDGGGALKTLLGGWSPASVKAAKTRGT